MRFDRRDFLGWSLSHLVVLTLPRTSHAAEGPDLYGIHAATRNTTLGVLRSPLRRRFARSPLRYKPYKGRERIRLPESSEPRGRPLLEVLREAVGEVPIGPRPLSLGQVARLLQLSNGVTGSVGVGPNAIALRAAPSAGALYSNEVYLVAVQVEGLASGVYNYDVLRNALVPLRRGELRSELADALPEPSRAHNAPAFVLLTNVFDRYTGRYANRGYRYSLIDSGHIGENLRLAARAQGLHAAEIARFYDDRLHELLEIDGRREAVCGMYAVGRAQSGDILRPALASRGASEKRERGSSSDGSDPERYHEGSKLVPDPGAPFTAPPTGVPIPLPPEPGIESEVSVDSAILTRRSTRRFADATLPRRIVERVGRLALGPALFPTAWPLELRVVIHRAEGRAPGLYSYSPRDDSLLGLRPGDLREDLRRACLRQDKAAQAGAAFLIIADLETASRLRGSRIYRDLCLQSGAIAQRIYLAAEAIGLTARNLAAFFDDELNALAGLDGKNRAILHLTLLGQGD